MFNFVMEEGVEYPLPPFSPDQPYPEFQGTIKRIDPSNQVFRLVRELFRKAGFDPDHYGTPQWNPLGELVRDQRKIVIKPNLVLHRVASLDCTIKSLVTNPSVIRAVTDYVLLAGRKLGQTLEIAIADTPLQSADFAALCGQSGLDALMKHYQEQGEPVRLYDLRPLHAVINRQFLILDRKKLPGDPAGARVIDLASLSQHCRGTELDRRLSIQDFDDTTTNENHRGNVHRYCFSGTVLEAGLVINLCKLKCHVKAGVTLSLKNVIGANVSKDYLPHFVPGSPEEGGDEFARRSLRQRLVRNVRDYMNRREARRLSAFHSFAKRLASAASRFERRRGQPDVYAGGWYGNDTLWRTIVDINRILYFADRGGILQNRMQRKIIQIVDGIYGMEGEGPIKGKDVRAGLLAFGDNPVEFDAKLAWIMGFDPAHVPHLAFWRNAADFRIGSFHGELEFEAAGWPNLQFREPFGWRGRLARSHTKMARPA